MLKRIISSLKGFFKALFVLVQKTVCRELVVIVMDVGIKDKEEI